MDGCDIRRRDKLFAGNGGMVMLGGNASKITVSGNTLRSVTLGSIRGNAEVVLRRNVFIGCGPMNFSNPNTLVEENYVHQPLLNSSFGLLGIRGTIRNNLFLRTGRIYDEMATADSIAHADYNLWAGTKTRAPSAGPEWTSKRFVRITLTGKKEGDEGFGARDVLAPLSGDTSFDPKRIVQDPDFVLPFSDDETLARKHTIKECLELYRKAYTPTAGSPERVHSNFRWWSDYAGGIITDWGQHHMDIAYWGMDLEDSGPLWIEGSAIFPNEGRADCYDNPDRFVIRMKFPGEIDLLYFVAHDKKYRERITPAEEARLFVDTQPGGNEGGRNGIMFTGDRGRVFVNRGGIYGKAVDELKEHPLPENRVRLDESNDHMGNLFECVKSRKEPISPVRTAHRVITACHLGNIAVRLKRRIHWDAAKEEVVGDAEAAASMYVRRPQRKPYEIG